MKATLHFNLPEDREDLDEALLASTYRRALSEIREQLRAKVKYTDEVPESWQQVQQLFFDIITGLEIDV